MPARRQALAWLAVAGGGVVLAGGPGAQAQAGDGQGALAGTAARRNLNSSGSGTVAPSDIGIRALPSSSPCRHGSPPRPGIGGGIALTDHYGERFSWERLAGRPALLFFGFTRCTSTCPVALHQARLVLDAFQARRGPLVLFVTLDPLQDDPATLRRRLGAFDARVLGLTGDPAQVQAAADRYGVGHRPTVRGPEHSSVWYLIGRHGRVDRVYEVGTPVSHLIEDLRRVQAAAKELTWS